MPAIPEQAPPHGPTSWLAHDGTDSPLTWQRTSLVILLLLDFVVLFASTIQSSLRPVLAGLTGSVVFLAVWDWWAHRASRNEHPDLLAVHLGTERVFQLGQVDLAMRACQAGRFLRLGFLLQNRQDVPTAVEIERLAPGPSRRLLAGETILPLRATVLPSSVVAATLEVPLRRLDCTADLRMRFDRASTWADRPRRPVRFNLHPALPLDLWMGWTLLGAVAGYVFVRTAANLTVRLAPTGGATPGEMPLGWTTRTLWSPGEPPSLSIEDRSAEP